MSKQYYVMIISQTNLVNSDDDTGFSFFKININHVLITSLVRFGSLTPYIREKSEYVGP